MYAESPAEKFSNFFNMKSVPASDIIMLDDHTLKR